MRTTTKRQVQKEIQNKLKRCNFCSEIVLAEAKKCKHCGEFLDPKLRTSPLPEQKWNPVTVALLSLLVPGGGHIYRGKPVRGFLWLIFVAVGYRVYLFPGIFLHLISIIFALMGNQTKE